MVNLGYCTISFIEQNYIEMIITAYSEIGIDETKAIAIEVSKLTSNTAHPGLVILSEFVSFSSQSREYAASEEGFAPFTKLAYVMANSGQAIVGNFYLTVNRPIKPVKFFYNKNKALHWLLN